MANFEYIDDCLKGEMPGKAFEFEQKILTDKEFAEEVAFFLSSKKVAQLENEAFKKTRFKEIYIQNNSGRSSGGLVRLWPYAAMMAAAISAIFIGVYLFGLKSDAPQLADTYLNSHLQTLGVQMSNTDDLLQQGKDLYNEKNYLSALEKFETLLKSEPGNNEARENAGLTALRLKKYEKALVYFSEEAKDDNLNENPGKFYKALTLMERNGTGDKEVYTALLKEIVKDGDYGKEEAEAFLGKLN